MSKRDYQGRSITGTVRSLPSNWYEDMCEGRHFRYSAGDVSGLVFAIVSYDHKRGGWAWRLHAGSEYVPTADNQFSEAPCKTALQAIKAVQRAAKRHSVARSF